MAKFSASATIERFKVKEDGITLFLRGSASSRINDENEEYILFRSNESGSNRALLLKKKNVSFNMSQQGLKKCFSEVNLLLLLQQHTKIEFMIDEKENSNAYEIVEFTVG